jgi:hypothetical protein
MNRCNSALFGFGKSAIQETLGRWRELQQDHAEPADDRTHDIALEAAFLKIKGWLVWTRVTKVVNRAWRLRWCKPTSRARRSRSLPMVPRIGRAGRWRERWGSASRPCSGCGRQARLKPHRLDRYMASNDPRFGEKAADIIGLYMNPPQHAAVFCVDEKTAIQALDRLDPVLPLSPGRAERHGFEYLSLWHALAVPALDVKTGWCTA